MASLVVRRLNQRPWRYLAAAPLVVGALVGSSTGSRRPRFNRALVRLALHGVDADRYAALVASTVARLRTRENSSVVELAAARRTTGRTIVVTATETTLAASFLSAVGLHGIEVVGSSLAFGPRDQVALADHNVGEQKVTSMRRLGIDLEKATFYTDSASDLPLILATARTFLVDPSARSERRIRKTIAALQASTRPDVRIFGR